MRTVVHVCIVVIVRQTAAPPTSPQEANKMTTATYTMNTLYQSRNGGKIHYQGCGHRSLHIHPVKGTQGMTPEQAVEKYGDQLCTHCFPQVKELKSAAPAAPAKPATPAAEYCTGSGTRDWANGTETPERHGYAASNGGKCGHCNEWAGTTTPYTRIMRKHKIKK